MRTYYKSILVAVTLAAFSAPEAFALSRDNPPGNPVVGLTPLRLCSDDIHPDHRDPEYSSCSSPGGSRICWLQANVIFDDTTWMPPFFYTLSGRTPNGTIFDGRPGRWGAYVDTWDDVVWGISNISTSVMCRNAAQINDPCDTVFWQATGVQNASGTYSCP